MCILHITDCAQNEVKFERNCYDKANPGEECMIAEQCQKESFCENGICSCVSPMILKSGSCVLSQFFFILFLFLFQ